MPLFRRLLPLLAASSLAACIAPGSGSASAAAAADSAHELVARRGDFEKRVLLTGSLQAARAIPLGVPRNPSWQVEVKWLAEDGSDVRAGDPVVELDDSTFATELENLESTLAERLAELEARRLEVRLEEREKGFEVTSRKAQVAKAHLEAEVPEGLVPRQDIQARRLALERAELERAKAEAELAAHRKASAADLEILRIDLRKVRREIDASRAAVRELQVRAPVDGIFLVGEHPRHDRKIQVGDTVWVGLTVATIPDLASMVVEARLPDVDDGSIAPGMPAVVVLDSYPGTPFEGRVREVAPVARDEGLASQRRFFQAVVELDEVDPRRMIPGMSARVEVAAERLDDVVLVPRRTLRKIAPGEARLHLSGGAARDVVLGPCNELECVVKDVEPGARLAAAGGASGVAEGAP